jgi:hypothetical protein
MFSGHNYEHPDLQRRYPLLTAPRTSAVCWPEQPSPVTLLGIVEDPPTTNRCVKLSIARPTFCGKLASSFGRHPNRRADCAILGETSAGMRSHRHRLRRKNTGHFWQSQRTYEIIKAVEPPVLVAIGAHERLSRILLCSGGKRFIDDAVRLTATLAAALRAEVTLFHIMASLPRFTLISSNWRKMWMLFASARNLAVIWRRKKGPRKTRCRCQDPDPARFHY